MKRITSTITGLIIAVSASADISWFVSANPILGPDNEGDVTETSFNTPLTPSTAFNDPDGGYFVQLIYAGANGVADAIPSPNNLNDTVAVQNDDVVVDTRWIGAGIFFGAKDGLFNAGNPYPNDIEGGQYFLRAWVGESQDQSLVLNADPTARVPLAINGTHWWYGDSDTWLNPGDGPGVPINHSVDFSATSPIVANNLVQAIPEPSTFALLGIGGLLVVSRMRRK